MQAASLVFIKGEYYTRPAQMCVCVYSCNIVRNSSCLMCLWVLKYNGFFYACVCVGLSNGVCYEDSRRLFLFSKSNFFHCTRKKHHLCISYIYFLLRKFFHKHFSFCFCLLMLKLCEIYTFFPIHWNWVNLYFKHASIVHYEHTYNAI